MREPRTVCGFLLLASVLALGLVGVVWATDTVSSEAQEGKLYHCPQAGKWAIALWGGEDGTDAEQALAGCGAAAVAAAYSIDPQTQVWSRWFAGRPEISNLGALHNMQGLILLGGAGATASPTPSPTPAVSADDDPFVGPEDAPVTIVEFSDFQCPFCKRFADETLGQILETYEGQVKYVFRDYPLTSIHPWAQKAAEAAECADDQGRFWEYHDLLFESQSALNSTFQTEGLSGVLGAFKSYAADLGLDSTAFNDCLDSGKHTSEVQGDLQDGYAYGVTGTPTHFIDGVQVKGAQPFSAYEAAIDSALTEAEGAMRQCPPQGKWAIAVWDGAAGVAAGQALATCGANAVAAAYSIDPDTQVWSRWFAGRPEISNLAALSHMQGVIVLGGAMAPATPTPTPTAVPSPTSTPTAAPTLTPTPTPASAPTPVLGGPPSDYLDSFHFALDMSMQVDGLVMDLGSEGDFEGPASLSCDFSTSMDGVTLIEAQVVVIGDKAWIDTGGGWRETTASDSEVVDTVGMCPGSATFWEGSSFYEAALLPGEHESKNGVAAVHYSLTESFEALAIMGLILGELEGVSFDEFDLWLAEDVYWLVSLAMEMSMDAEALEQFVGLPPGEIESITMAMSIDITQANDTSIRVSEP